MPPRQPLKLPKAKQPLPARGRSGAALAAQMLAEEAAPAIKPKLPSGFSPYPDLTMAITMLAKRQQALAPDAERAKLVGRLHGQLQEVQAAMQKLYKLEQLAGRLSKK